MQQGNFFQDARDFLVAMEMEDVMIYLKVSFHYRKFLATCGITSTIFPVKTVKINEFRVHVRKSQSQGAICFNSFEISSSLMDIMFLKHNKLFGYGSQLKIS